MKAIEVRNQVRLSPGKCLELVLSGVRFRLFRAAITVVIISLAVAFLMTILTESLTAREVAATISSQTAPRRLFLLWVSRISSPITEAELTTELYAGHAQRLAELKAWGHLTDAELAKLQDVARRQIDPKTGCIPFFESLSEGKRRPLVGAAKGAEILTVLSDPKKFNVFEKELLRLGKPFPMTMGNLKTFLADWRDAAGLRARVLAGHRRAVDATPRLLKGRRPREFLAEADDALPHELGALGYKMTADDLRTIRTQASVAIDSEIIERSLGSPFLKGMLARRRSVKVPKVTTHVLFDEASSAKGARWLAELTDSAKGLRPLNMSGDRIHQAALSQVILSDAQLAEKLASARPGELNWQSPVLWGKLKDAEVQALKDLAKRQVEYTSFFKGVSDKDRRAMLGPPDPKNPFGRILSEDGFKNFLNELKSLGKELPVPYEATVDLQKVIKRKGLRSDSPEADQVFRHFLKRWQATRDLREQIVAGRAKALSAVKAILSRPNAQQVLASNASLRSGLVRHGAGFAARNLKVPRKQASDTLAARQMAAMLQVPLIRRQFAIRRRSEPHKVTEADLYDELSSEDGSRWFADLLGKVSGLKPLGLNVKRISEAAQTRLDQSRLATVEANVSQAATSATDGGFAGLSARTMWIVVVSFMVCIIGIANAMLMSVTERFREIATMKCLGATDGFIMVNFVLESCLQGVVGGLIGSALGLVLGVLRASGQYGLMALQELPWSQAAEVGLLSLAVGLAISALAAVYPAWAAARLAPMEAMRIE